VNTKGRETYTKARKKERKRGKYWGWGYREGKTGQFGMYKKNEDKNPPQCHHMSSQTSWSPPPAVVEV